MLYAAWDHLSLAVSCVSVVASHCCVIFQNVSTGLNTDAKDLSEIRDAERYEMIQKPWLIM